jgi:hypothetical protein
MSHLLQYLNDNHSKSDYDSIKNDFSQKFGVNVKEEDEFFLFKYGMITANWNEPITKECRGAILKNENGKWAFMARPFDKFFNQHEGHCPIFNPKVFEEKLPNLSLAVKSDGTCIQLWHSGIEWRVSTLGSITTLNAHESNKTFDRLFLDTIGNVFWDKLNQELTYIFELCTEENRIVTKYSSDHAVLLGARNRNSGLYLDNYEEILSGAFAESNVVTSYRILPASIGHKTLEDVKLFVEEMSEKEDHGKYPEGYVVYDENLCPIAKMKNAKYVSLHHVGGGDIEHSKNQIIDSIFLGFIDDVYDVLSDRLKLFADEIKHNASEIELNAMNVAELISKNQFASRKDFALFVQKNADQKVQSFFFKNSSEFMSNQIDDVLSKFELWLKENYKKFEWKNKS